MDTLIQTMNEPFKKPLPDTDLYYFDTREAIENIEAGAYDKLPFAQKYYVKTWFAVARPKT